MIGDDEEHCELDKDASGQAGFNQATFNSAFVVPPVVKSTDPTSKFIDSRPQMLNHANVYVFDENWSFDNKKLQFFIV
jgi:hypothetical protein